MAMPRLFFAVLALATLRSTFCIYLTDSKHTERLVQSRELCYVPEVEFWDPTLKDAYRGEQMLYSREPFVKSTSRLRLRALEENGPDVVVGYAMEKIYENDIMLSETMLLDSVSNLGNLEAVRKFVAKLVTGRPVKVVTLGGSVAAGHGVNVKENRFVERFHKWISNTFPNPGHVFVDAAVPATTSGFISPCVLEMVPPDADLILMEFTLNDSERGSHSIEDPGLRALERMLRKLMRLPSQPAIVWLHYWSFKLNNRYDDSAEDAINILLKYYHILGLSMRDALHSMKQTNPERLSEFWHPQIDPDHVHPSCIGSRFMGDMLIAHFQDLAASEVVGHYGVMLNSGLRGRDQRAGGEVYLDPPLQLENWGNRTEQCVMEPERFKPMARPIQGFEWKDDNADRPGKSPKWGWVAYNPGSVIEVDVPVMGLGPDLTIGFGFLLSYEHMGFALLECIRGCSCHPREYSFTHPYGTSITSWRILTPTLDPGASHCTAKITVLNRSMHTPPEYKVKLNSIMVTEEKGFMMPWLHCDTCLGSNL